MWGVVIHLLREGPGAFTYGLTWPSGAVEDGRAQSHATINGA